MIIDLNLNKIFSINNEFYENNFIYDKFREYCKPKIKNASIKFKVNIDILNDYFIA